MKELCLGSLCRPTQLVGPQLKDAVCANNLIISARHITTLGKQYIITAYFLSIDCARKVKMPFCLTVNLRQRELNRTPKDGTVFLSKKKCDIQSVHVRQLSEKTNQDHKALESDKNSTQ